MIVLKHLSKAALAACLAIATLVPVAQASSTQTTFFEAPRDLTAPGSTDASRTAAFADFQTLGVKALRINMPWAGVAPTPDSATKPTFDATDPAAYNWGNYATVIDAAKAKGWKVLISLSSPVPKWATAAHTDYVTRPSADEYKLFATAASKRFGGPSVIWSIWNEPNLPTFLMPQVSGGKNVSGTIYRGLYIAGRDGIIAGGQASPTVLFGETAPVGGSHDGRTYPLAFLRSALCLTTKYKLDKSCGTKLTVSGIAHHPYQFSNSALKSDDVTYRNLSKLPTFLDKAAKGGAIQAKAPIYLTEFGIQSKPDRLLGVSQQKQLELRARVEREAYANTRIRGFSQYLLTDDNSTGTCLSCYGGFETGLRLAIGDKAKLSFKAFELTLDAEPSSNKNSKKVSLWGLVRPATGATTVVVEKRTSSKGTFKTWKKVKTKSNGAFTVSDPTGGTKSQYRYRWTSPTGKLTSPFVDVIPTPKA
ncbi:MAG: cellulase family glycosylhydrolase [Solirubrobacteraceae bacterium]|nr:cellulase family glycosylhydrolase [Patulibacter sp.]